MEGERTISEESIVRKIARAARASGRPTRKSAVEVSIGDDAAIWKPKKGFDTVLTTDWFLEGTHFWRDWHPAEAVGWKCLTRAASDVAAMGGDPKCFLLSLALPASCAETWLNGFLQGLTEAATKLKCPLVGGDTTRNDRMLINISVVGELRSGKAVPRNGAKPGDRIFVSGRLGEAELGLEMARQQRKVGGGARSPLLEKHLRPEARVELGKWLARDRLATAMMDLSDGLSSDLARLCDASKAGAQIELDRVPFAAVEFRKRFVQEELRQAALHGGDDYELLFCVANRDLRRVPGTFRGVKLTEIGRITRGSTVELVDSSRQIVPLRPLGWNPF
ncbi:MAG TPA: thiamine-phosphate kinase [Candidatus Dormibacteraeota bacterium]|nr:thiamine-phosphate kinase [Candidatus Dormibacteraeota bacterium]